MEFQLVASSKTSTGEKAYRYTKFLDDEVIIPANSSIHLNHATLGKTEGVKFREEQTLSLSWAVSDTLGGVSTGSLTQPSLTISADNYTYDQLRDEIRDGINTILSNNSNYLANYRYGEVVKNGEELYGVLGQSLNPYAPDTTTFAEAGISIGTSLIDDDFPLVFSDVASGVSPNAFYLDPYPYFHVNQVYKNDENIYITDNVPSVAFSLNEETAGTLSPADFINKTASEGVSARLYCGLYGQQYALSDDVGTGTRTNGTTIQNVPGEDFADVPTMFLCAGIETYDGEVYARIYWPRSSTNGTITNWNSQQVSIDEMKLVKQYPLDKTSDDDINITIQTYCKDEYEDEKDIYFVVSFIYGDNVETFDSGEDLDLKYPYAFFTGLDATGNNTILRSQLAFHPAIATNIQNYGATLISENSMVSDTDFIIRKFNYSASDELAKVLKFYSGFSILDVSNIIYPNVEPITPYNPRTGLNLEFQDIFRLLSYVIRIKNLPIETYKTNYNRDQRGYRQAIVGVVPTPYQNLLSSSVISSGNQNYVNATYNPPYPLMKNMKNQELVLNRFDIEITDLLDDTLAEDIEECAINFTITPPKL